MARILVLTLDIVPTGGGAATGAGLRAWGLGEGLRMRGHEVGYAMPDTHARALPRVESISLFQQDRIDDFLDSYAPDVAIFQHWPLAAMIASEHDAAIAIDFHGPLLLETIFRDAEAVASLAGVKLRALSRADFFTCASRSQLYYYTGYLLLAGFDVRQLPIAVVPFSMPPELPHRDGWPSPPTFVYGGVFLPWQDPTTGLRLLVEELERTETATLKMFGGKHPWLEVGADERYEAIQELLRYSRRVVFAPTLPRSELIAEYTQATVAWDLMAHNIEREMAFTSRTVEYLWCGLPVVYNDYAELASYIAEADAGWTLDPEDAKGIRETVREIVNDPDAVARKGTNARHLARDRLVWDRTIEPLDAFCREPRRAPRLAAQPLMTEPTAGLPATVIPGSPSSRRRLRSAVLGLRPLHR